MEPLLGLRLDIVRQAHTPDCSNRGISASVDRVTLVATRDHRGNEKPLDTTSRVFSPDPDAPPVVLIERRLGDRTIFHLAPYGQDGWFMFGGTYAVGDSRFSDLTRMYGAVALHDRQE